MEGGIAVLLIVLIAGVAAAWMLTGGLGAALAKFARPKENDGPRPLHTVAEPRDEHAAGYGVRGEYGSDPRPARVRGNRAG